ncbi:TolC family protein [Polynucleobacter sp. AP-Nino-20-G2]|nr:TolC family protein [Polynucleobacter sp. AP-Nino-20-G2]
MTLSTYLNELNEKNPALRAKKLTADSAASTAKQAGMPYLSPILTYARGSVYTQAPYTGYTNPASNTVGATVTVEGWGKRSAREAYAQSEANRHLAEMIVETRSVETQAIFNYIDALRTKLLWQSYQSAIDKLSAYKGQDVSSHKTEFLAAQKVLANDLKYYSYGLVNFLGNPNQPLPLPVGMLNIPPQKFTTKDLVERAQDNRADLTSSKASIESAAANLEMVKAGKNPDFLPGLYYTETPPYSSNGVGYGAQKSFSFLLSIPLGNGLLNDSDLIAASNTVAEQEVNLVAAKTKIVTEINQTYLQYQAAKDRLETAAASYSQAKPSQNLGLQGLLKFREAEYELIDARTVHAKTLILLQRLSGDFDVPNLN